MSDIFAKLTTKK